MNITYRPHRTDDLPAIQRLWNQTDGWGGISDEMWRHYTSDAPHGEPMFILADREGAGVIGEFVFLPLTVSVRGRVVRAFRPAAPILDVSERRNISINPMKHPAVGMFMHGVRQIREQGAGLLVMLPDPRWVPVLRMMPSLQTGSFPLWSLPLPLRAPVPLPPGYAADPLDRWDASEVDALWTRFARLHAVQVVRDARMLAWRLATGGHVVTAVRRDGDLVGLVAAHRKGDRQWLVSEILAADADEALRATIAAACDVAHREAIAGERSQPIHKIALLATPVIERVVRTLGFTRDAYDFPVVVQVLDPTIAPADVAPADWYVSPLD